MPGESAQKIKNYFKRLRSWNTLQELFELGLIGIGIHAMIYWLPRRYFLDGDKRLEAVRSLLEHGKLSWMNYSFVGPLFSAPLEYIDKLEHINFWQQRYNVVLLAVMIFGCYALLRNQIDRRLLRIFFLILMVASMFGNHVTYFGGEVFTALFIGLGLLIAESGWAWSGLGAVVLGVVNTPVVLAGLACTTMGQLLMRRRVRYVLVCVAAVVLILGEAWIRRGSPFNLGYPGQTFSTPFLIGLLSIIFSFGKGLLFFAPGLVLPVVQSILRLPGTASERMKCRQQDNQSSRLSEVEGDGSDAVGEEKSKLLRVYGMWISFLVGLVLVYAGWWAWYGGWFWGPRFFLFASIPASFALAVRLRAPGPRLLVNVVTLLIFGFSLWIGINGAIYDQHGMAQVCQANDYAQEYLCHYHPLFSALWYPIEHPMVLGPYDTRYIVYSLCVFAYLAIPLIWEIGRQSITWVKVSGRVVLKWRLRA